jgi:hypothetical protein
MSDYRKHLDQRIARAIFMPEEMTASELADLLYPGIRYEDKQLAGGRWDLNGATALPSDFVEEQLARYWDPRGHVVWGYLPGGSLDGEPLPLTQEAVEELEELEREKLAME